MLLSNEDIKKIIPHRYPFLLVDKIESIDEVLRMKVQFKRMIGGICIAGCEAYVDDKKVAYGEIFCALQDVE